MNDRPNGTTPIVAVITGATHTQRFVIPHGAPDIFLAAISSPADVRVSGTKLQLAPNHWTIQSLRTAECAVECSMAGMLVAVIGHLGSPCAPAALDAGEVWADHNYGHVWELLGHRPGDAVSIHYARTGCGRVTPPHFHVLGDESFVCLCGSGTIVNGSTLCAFNPGRRVLVPRGAPHTLTANRGSLEYLCIKTPADPAYTDRVLVGTHAMHKNILKRRNRRPRNAM